jgi:hypothetical protein
MAERNSCLCDWACTCRSTRRNGSGRTATGSNGSLESCTTLLLSAFSNVAEEGSGEETTCGGVKESATETVEAARVEDIVPVVAPSDAEKAAEEEGKGGKSETGRALSNGDGCRECLGRPASVKEKEGKGKKERRGKGEEEKKENANADSQSQQIIVFPWPPLPLSSHLIAS